MGMIMLVCWSQDWGTISQVRVSSSARRADHDAEPEETAMITMRVRPVAYFTCMKNSTTRSILHDGDGQGDHGVPAPEVDIGDPGGHRRADHQQKNTVRYVLIGTTCPVCRRAPAMLPLIGHAIALLIRYRPPIRYSSGNRKIQTISTKCQYRPLISSGSVILRTKTCRARP